MPGGEAAVALSVIAVGVLIAMRRTLPLGYLAGFSAIQLALAGGALLLHRHLRHGWSRPAASLIGGTAGAVGLFFLLV